jgi:cupin 2 domain-containing protein
MHIEHLYSGIPDALPTELIESLVSSDTVSIERIVSRGHASPPDFWYDQDLDEWVLLLAGAARLRFADQPALIDLRPGDHLNIPAHVRHRVEWTDPDATTIWLAVHYRGSRS